jgi:hypothetical protein
LRSSCKDPIFRQVLRLFDIERRSLKEAAEIVSISLTGGEELDKKEHQLFGEDGLEIMVDRVASIEKTLGIMSSLNLHRGYSCSW